MRCEVFREKGQSYGAQVAGECLFVPELKIKRVAGALDYDKFVFGAIADKSSGQGPGLADIDRAINEAVDDEYRRSIFCYVRHGRG